MHILVLHRNKFERMGYDVAIDHDEHEVVYAGTKQYVENVPPGVRCRTVVYEDGVPLEDQLRPWLAGEPRFSRLIARHEETIMPAAILREELGIPGMRTAEARNFRDKMAMKSTLAAAGIRTPRFVAAEELPDAEPWHGKTIAKPRDSRGSQGVLQFGTFAEAREFVDSQRGTEGFVHRYELEEFVEGPIWHVDGFLFDGVPAVAQPSRYIGTPLGFEHRKPIGSVQHPHPELAEWAVECLRVLGGRTLTFHLEAIETGSGLVFLEVAARCGGGYIVNCVRSKHGIHLHTLDMASYVEGALATRFIGPEQSPLAYGFFLYPGHLYDTAPCRVSVPDERLESPTLVNYQLRDPDEPTPAKHSYRPEDLPFSGVVAGPDPEALDEWIQGLFEEVVVTPETAAVVA
jgi:hypothetical protein